MNKDQREKLTELEAQLQGMITSARTLLDEEQIFLDGLPYGERDIKTTEDIVIMLRHTIVAYLAPAAKCLIDIENMADTPPNQGGTKWK